MDGGIRRGVDIVKALALGARACLSARALVYGLGAGGLDAGAARAMRLLTEELRLTLELAGCRSVRDLDEHGSPRSATASCETCGAFTIAVVRSRPQLSRLVIASGFECGLCHAGPVSRNVQPGSPLERNGQLGTCRGTPSATR